MYVHVHACQVASVVSDCDPMAQATRLLCPWDSPGKNTGVGCHALLQGIFPTQESNLYLQRLLYCRQVLYPPSHLGNPFLRMCCAQSSLTLCDLWTVACQAPLSLGFSRQEYWSGLPRPPPGGRWTQGLNTSLTFLHVRAGSLPLASPRGWNRLSSHRGLRACLSRENG